MLAAEPDTVEPGGMSCLTVSASDPNCQLLSYSYLKSECNLLIYIGGKMRMRVLLGLAMICLAVWSSSSVAVSYKCYSAPDTCQVCWDTTGTPAIMQVLDLGACDTVRIGCPVCVNDLTVGDSFQVPIYLYNDAPLGGIALPFRHYGRYLRFGFGGDYGLDCTDGTVLTPIQQGGIYFVADEKADTASALLGWVDFSGRRQIPANTTGEAKLLGYLYLVLTDTIQEIVRFDTSFYPPIGEYVAALFLTNPALTPEEFPKFVPPCDINLDDTPFGNCGDVDGSSHIDIADIVYMVNYIFRNGVPPQDPRGGDMDCDLRVTIADVVHLINYIFRAGPEPCLGCK